MEFCDRWQQVEIVQHETGKRIGCTTPQGNRARYWPFRRRRRLPKLAPGQEAIPLWRRCRTRVVEDGKKDSGTNGRQHYFREGPNVRSRLPPKLQVGIRCMRNPLMRCGVAVPAILNRPGWGGGEGPSSVNKCGLHLSRGYIEVLFRRCPVCP